MVFLVKDRQKGDIVVALILKEFAVEEMIR